MSIYEFMKRAVIPLIAVVVVVVVVCYQRADISYYYYSITVTVLVKVLLIIDYSAEVKSINVSGTVWFRGKNQH